MLQRISQLVNSKAKSGACPGGVAEGVTAPPPPPQALPVKNEFYQYMY